VPKVNELGIDVAGEYIDDEHLIKVTFTSPDMEDCKAEVQFTIDHDPELVFACVASINEGVKQVLKEMLTEVGLLPLPEEDRTPGTE
jgi:translation elongation factor EF-4